MPRPPRYHRDDLPLHVMNRGNRKGKVFFERADYLGFIGALAHAGERTSVRLLAYCLMPNHFHLVLWPVVGNEVSAYMQLLMNAHIRDLLHRREVAGTGHFYQGRYKDVPVFNALDLKNVLRYVEANAFAAGLCAKAEQWEWSSLVTTGPDEGINMLTSWPIPRPANWLDLVNQPPKDKLLRELRSKARVVRNSEYLVSAI